MEDGGAMSAPLGAQIGGVAPPALKEELGRWSRALLLAFGGPYRHTFGQPRYKFYPSIVSYRYLLITVSYIFATLVLGIILTFMWTIVCTVGMSCFPLFMVIDMPH